MNSLTQQQQGRQPILQRERSRRLKTKQILVKPKAQARLSKKKQKNILKLSGIVEHFYTRNLFSFLPPAYCPLCKLPRGISLATVGNRMLD